MSTPKEKLQEKEKLLGDYLTGVLKTIEIERAHIGNISQGVTNFFDSLNKIGELNKQEFLQYRVEFQESFLSNLQKTDDHRTQLAFVHEQIKQLQLKIGNAKMDNEPFYQHCFETILNNLVIPLKVQLTELVQLENEVGTLKKVVSESNQELDALVTATPKAPHIQSDLKAQTEVVVPPEKSEEIFIPINIVDKSLETQTGKPLNNAKYIAGGRKFTWSDERIPNLIGLFLLEHRRIFDYQLNIVQDFFKTARCNYKIVFDGNANILTTILYDLLGNDYLKVSTEFLAERLESVFVRKENTTRPLITKNSIRASIKPTNVDRRLKKDAPDYPNIVSWLQKKLHSPA